MAKQLALSLQPQWPHRLLVGQVAARPVDMPSPFQRLASLLYSLGYLLALLHFEYCSEMTCTKVDGCCTSFGLAHDMIFFFCSCGLFTTRDEHARHILTITFDLQF